MYKNLVKVCTAIALCIVPMSVFAANLQVDLPYGIGTVQLPWQATEGGYGMFKPVKGGLWQQAVVASLPILTIGRLSSGYRIIDGSIGVAGSWPSVAEPVNVYGGLGHDIVQDIPGLSQYASLHLNAGGTYDNAIGGWCWGGTLSFAPGGSVNTAGSVPIAPPASSKLELYPSVTGA